LGPASTTKGMLTTNPTNLTNRNIREIGVIRGYLFPSPNPVVLIFCFVLLPYSMP
jgi:hypothetical protein